VIDASALQMVLLVLTGWLERREREAVAYLIEENRLLRRQLGGRRLRLRERTDPPAQPHTGQHDGDCRKEKTREPMRGYL
jgi:hypothetical protein